MMALISSLLKIISAISQYLQNKQLIDAGKATAERDILIENNKKIKDANQIDNRDDDIATVAARLRERNNK